MPNKLCSCAKPMPMADGRCCRCGFDIDAPYEPGAVKNADTDVVGWGGDYGDECEEDASLSCDQAASSSMTGIVVRDSGEVVGHAEIGPASEAKAKWTEVALPTREDSINPEWRRERDARFAYEQFCRAAGEQPLPWMDRYDKALRDYHAKLISHLVDQNFPGETKYRVKFAVVPWEGSADQVENALDRALRESESQLELAWKARPQNCVRYVWAMPDAHGTVRELALIPARYEVTTFVSASSGKVTHSIHKPGGLPCYVPGKDMHYFPHGLTEDDKKKLLERYPDARFVPFL